MIIPSKIRIGGQDISIINAAKKHYNDINCFNAFVHGVGWAELHPVDVWHEASEKPRAKEWMLIQFGEDDYEALALDDLGVDTWAWWCKNYKVIRWAYISDLLPKGGER